jgi:hypothetical protein
VIGRDRPPISHPRPNVCRQSHSRSVRPDAALYGIVGNPIAHSLSPAIMNAAFRRENVNAVYLGLHAKTMKDLRACMKDIPISGLSVTMPYKQEILEDLDNTDPYTAKTGACNTVVRGQDGKLYVSRNFVTTGGHRVSAPSLRRAFRGASESPERRSPYTRPERGRRAAERRHSRRRSPASVRPPR